MERLLAHPDFSEPDVSAILPALTSSRRDDERRVAGRAAEAAAAFVELARVAHKQRDYQGALGYLANARDLEPNNASLSYFFGLVCLDLDLVAESLKTFQTFQTALKIEPENPAYNYARGVASVFRHDPSEAIHYFEKYSRLKPQDALGKLALGAALFRAKQYDGRPGC